MQYLHNIARVSFQAVLTLGFANFSTVKIPEFQRFQYSPPVLEPRIPRRPVGVHRSCGQREILAFYRTVVPPDSQARVAWKALNEAFWTDIFDVRYAKIHDLCS